MRKAKLPAGWQRSTLTIAISVCLGAAVASPATAQSIRFGYTGQFVPYDHGRQLEIPEGFGEGEFTLELWVKLDTSFDVGSTRPSDSENQRSNWTIEDNEPYFGSSWWFEGNFLLDGHCNCGLGAAISLQFVGGGRVRWLFGDEADLWTVQAYPSNTTDTLLDDMWHQITLVRRWAGVASADLELWIDGVLIATEQSWQRTDMQAFYWQDWPGTSSNEAGWWWGAELQVAANPNRTYEDYKGLLDEIRLWSRAKTSAEIAADWRKPVTGSESGLVGYYSFDQGSGTSVCNSLGASECIELAAMNPGHWSTENAPVGVCALAATLEVSPQTVTEPASFEACDTVSAGDFVVGIGGEVTFRSGRLIALSDGFSVVDGGSFSAEVDQTVGF